MGFLTSLRCVKFVRNKKKRKEDELTPFLEKQLPIFWMTGPKGCGKSTLGEMLSKSSKYILVDVVEILRQETQKGKYRGKHIKEFLNKDQYVPNHIVIELLKEFFLATYDHAVGYILLGFPISLQQAKYFQRKVCKVSLIIYVTLVLDALLGRAIRKQGKIDEDELRIQHIRQQRHQRKILQHYETKTIIVQSNYPPEDTCTRLVTDLEDFWGYKFQRLYNKY